MFNNKHYSFLQNNRSFLISFTIEDRNGIRRNLNKFTHVLYLFFGKQERNFKK